MELRYNYIFVIARIRDDRGILIIARQVISRRRVGWIQRFDEELDIPRRGVIQRRVR
jgi:hypothetical protein